MSFADRMSQSLSSILIRQELESFIQRDDNLRIQLNQLLKQSKSPSNKQITENVSRGVQAIASDLFSSPLAGRFAKGLTQAYIAQQEQQTLSTQLSSLDAQHRYIVQSALGLIESISVRTATLKKPNSTVWVARVSRAQESVELEGRIKRTLRVLRAVAQKPLIYNRDIVLPTKVDRSRPTMPKLPDSFPRIGRILTQVVSLETRLRNHVRRTLRKEYGSEWIGQIRDKSGIASEKWSKISTNRGGIDLLDGCQFGDLINMINQFEVLRNGALSSDQARLALKIVQGERRMLVHPLQHFKTDIDETRYEIASMAILTLSSLLESE